MRAGSDIGSDACGFGAVEDPALATDGAFVTFDASREIPFRGREAIGGVAYETLRKAGI
jgi:hypothetical protein